MGIGRYWTYLSQHMKLRPRIRLVLLLTSLIPLIISTYIYYAYSVTILQNKMGESTIEVTKQVESKLDAFMQQLTSVSKMINYSQGVQYFLGINENPNSSQSIVIIDEIKEQFNHYNDVRQLTFSIGNLREDLKGIFLINDQNAIVSDIKEEWSFPVSLSFDHKEWFQRSNSSHSPMFMTGRYESYVEGQRVFTFAMPMISSIDMKEHGVLLWDFSPNVFQHTVESIGIGKTGFVFLIDRHGRAIYSNDHFDLQLLEPEILSSIKQGRSGYLHGSYEGRKVLLSYSSSNLSGLTVVGMVPTAEIASDLTRSIRIALLVIMASAASLILIISFYFSRTLTLPLLMLERAMKKVREGHLHYKFSHQRKDEIGQLGNTFNHMIIELNRLREENISIRLREYQLELDRKQAELHSLMAQINPHFLYNTLNTMKAISEIHHVDEVARMSHSLANMFKYSISGSHFASLRRELEHVQDYLTIISLRFNNQFKVHIHVPDYMLDFRIPKLIIQPLLENVFKHGFQHHETGTVWITCELTEDRMLLSVRDDGAGISKSKLEKIEQSLYEKKTLHPSNQHIGLLNIHKRLQLQYGQGAFIRLKTTGESGLQVTLYLPLDQ